MGMHWQQVEDIEVEFNLFDAEGDPKELRRLLRHKLKEVHPDSHNGKFATEDTESDFHRIKSAIDFLDKRLNRGLPVENRKALAVDTEFSTAIVQSFTDARNQDRDLERARQLQEKQRQTSEDLAEEVVRKFKFYKFVAAVLAGLFGILTFFPGKLAEHPVYSTVADFVERLDFTLGVFFLYAFIVCGLAIVYLWWEEQRELKRKKQCLSDKGIEKIIKSKAFEGRLGPLGKFTRADLIDALEEHRVSGDQNTLNAVAGLIIDKLMLRGAAKPVEGPSLNEIYEMDFGIYLEIRPDKI